MCFVTCLTTPNQAIGSLEQFESFTYTTMSQIQGKLKSTDFSVNLKKCHFKLNSEYSYITIIQKTETAA